MVVLYKVQLNGFTIHFFFSPLVVILLFFHLKFNRNDNLIMSSVSIAFAFVVRVQSKNLTDMRNTEQRKMNKSKERRNSLTPSLCSLGGTLNCTFLYITYLMNIYCGRRH